MAYTKIDDLNQVIKEFNWDKLIKLEAWSPESSLYSLNAKGFNLKWYVFTFENKVKSKLINSNLIAALSIDGQLFEPSHMDFNPSLKKKENYSSCACKKLIEILKD